MAKIQKFEDIESWKRARKLTKEVYTVTSRDKFSRDFGLRDQIRRAAVSILSNIAEGFERGGTENSFSFSLLQEDLVVRSEPNSIWNSFHWASSSRWFKRQSKRANFLQD